MAAASLPAELLCRIFAAARPPSSRAHDSAFESRTVLSFEERLRAELVCKHWRASLTAHPGSFTSLTISSPDPGCGWAGGGRSSPAQLASAVAKAAARARALAASAPNVASIHLMCVTRLPPELLAAYKAALSALLAVPGAGRSVQAYLGADELGARSTPFADQTAALLAGLAPHASCERLVLVWRGQMGNMDARLAASRELPSLPHVRHLTVHTGHNDLLSIQLHMPRLEELIIPEEPEMFAPLVSAAVGLVGAGGGGGGAGSGRATCRRPAAPPPMFPALRRLQLASQRLVLSPAAVPALQELSVTLHCPAFSQLSLHPGTLSALTSLDLGMTSQETGAMLRESMGFDSDDEGDLSISVPSNLLAPLLDAAPPTLRSLTLTVGERPDAAMSAALKAQQQLTRLSLRFNAVEGRPPAKGIRLPCSLLAGMSRLRLLSVDAADRLDRPAVLARLPALGTLTLAESDGLARLAPHLPHLTSLVLPKCTAAALRSREAACAALGGLTALRSLVLGGRKCFYSAGKDLKAAAARHAQALAALPVLLPAGCQVLAREPFVGSPREEEVEEEEGAAEEDASDEESEGEEEGSDEEDSGEFHAADEDLL